MFLFPAGIAQTFFVQEQVFEQAEQEELHVRVRLAIDIRKKHVAESKLCRQLVQGEAEAADRSFPEEAGPLRRLRLLLLSFAAGPFFAIFNAGGHPVRVDDAHNRGTDAGQAQGTLLGDAHGRLG